MTIRLVRHDRHLAHFDVVVFDLGILQRLSAGVRANLGLDDKMTKKLAEGQVR